MLLIYKDLSTKNSFPIKMNNLERKSQSKSLSIWCEWKCYLYFVNCHNPKQKYSEVQKEVRKKSNFKNKYKKC